METLPLWAASGLCVIWTFVHVVIGGRDIVPYLRDSTLPNGVRGTFLMVWHMMSVVLVAMVLIFAGAAVTALPGLAWAGALLAGLMSFVGFAVPPVLHMRYRDLPQGWLLLPVALLALSGT